VRIYVVEKSFIDEVQSVRYAPLSPRPKLNLRRV